MWWKQCLELWKTRTCFLLPLLPIISASIISALFIGPSLTLAPSNLFPKEARCILLKQVISCHSLLKPCNESQCQGFSKTPQGSARSGPWVSLALPPEPCPSLTLLPDHTAFLHFHDYSRCLFNSGALQLLFWKPRTLLFTYLHGLLPCYLQGSNATSSRKTSLITCQSPSTFPVPLLILFFS